MIIQLCMCSVCKQDDNELLKKNERFSSLVLQLMYDMFGSKNVQQSDDKMIQVTLDNNTAKLDPFNVVSILHTNYSYIAR